MTVRSEVLRLLDVPDALLRPSEVATLFGVDPKTVARWSRAGRLPALRTAGGAPSVGETGSTTFDLLKEVVANHHVIQRGPVEDLRKDFDTLPEGVHLGAEVPGNQLVDVGDRVAHDGLLALHPDLDVGDDAGDRLVGHGSSPIATHPGLESLGVVTSVGEPPPRVDVPSPTSPEADGHPEAASWRREAAAQVRDMVMNQHAVLANDLDAARGDVS